MLTFAITKTDRDMKKKAYLVTFTATTRIVVEGDGNPSEDDSLRRKIVEEAYIRMGDLGFENYLNDENSEVTEDTECPYGTFDND